MALTSLTSLNSLTSPFAKVDAGILHNVFFECLLEIEMIVPKINLIIGHSLPAVLAVCAQGLFCRCPLVVQRMPIRRSVRDHAVARTSLTFLTSHLRKLA